MANIPSITKHSHRHRSTNSSSGTHRSFVSLSKLKDLGWSSFARRLATHNRRPSSGNTSRGRWIYEKREPVALQRLPFLLFLSKRSPFASVLEKFYRPGHPLFVYGRTSNGGGEAASVRVEVSTHHSLQARVYKLAPRFSEVKKYVPMPLHVMKKSSWSNIASIGRSAYGRPEHWAFFPQECLASSFFA